MLAKLCQAALKIKLNLANLLRGGGCLLDALRAADIASTSDALRPVVNYYGIWQSQFSVKLVADVS